MRSTATRFLLEQTRIDEKQKEYLRGIHNSAEGLLKLINQILDFSKIEAGHLVIENTAFFLKELLSEVESIFREQAERKGLFLRFEIDDAVPDAIMGDPLRLRQVLINLMGNAFKFTERRRCYCYGPPSGKGKRRDVCFGFPLRIPVSE